jgi:hypothetical protein
MLTKVHTRPSSTCNYNASNRADLRLLLTELYGLVHHRAAARPPRSSDEAGLLLCVSHRLRIGEITKGVGESAEIVTCHKYA